MSIVFPMIRLVADEETGMAPEIVTRREFELLMYEYSAIDLAGYWASEDLSFRHVTLTDLDHDKRALIALLPKHAELEFAMACKDFVAERMCDMRDDTVSNCGYSWAPIGQNEGFGFEAPLLAWLITIKDSPILLYRERDADGIEEPLNKWLEFWYEKPLPRAWPQASEKYAGLIVPNEFQSTTSLLGLSVRKRPRKRRGRYGVFR